MFQLELQTRREKLESTLYRMSAAECFSLVGQRYENINKPSFDEFAASKSVDVTHHSMKVLNGILGGFMAKEMSGSKSSYRDVKPGLNSSDILAKLKKDYKLAIEAGDVIKVEVQKNLNPMSKADNAHVAIFRRRSVKWAVRNGCISSIHKDNRIYMS